MHPLLKRLDEAAALVDDALYEVRLAQAIDQVMESACSGTNGLNALSDLLDPQLYPCGCPGTETNVMECWDGYINRVSIEQFVVGNDPMLFTNHQMFPDLYGDDWYAWKGAESGLEG